MSVHRMENEMPVAEYWTWVGLAVLDDKERKAAESGG